MPIEDAADDLLSHLRGAGRPRPAVDEILAASLLERLEEAAAPAELLPEDTRLTVSKSALRGLLACERRHVASFSSRSDLTAEMVAGRMVDQLFSQILMGVPPGEDPVGDALTAAASSGRDDLASEWEALAEDDREQVRYSLPLLATKLVAAWPVLPPAALPRVEEPLRVLLAGGRVVLSGRPDLVLGGPGARQVGTTILDVKSGTPRPDDIEDARFYGLLETLRHRAPAFQTGNFYVRHASVLLEPVTEEVLVHQTERVVDTLGRLLRLQRGKAPRATPSGLCSWCPVLERCPEGKTEMRKHGGSGGGWS